MMRARAQSHVEILTGGKPVGGAGFYDQPTIVAGPAPTDGGSQHSLKSVERSVDMAKAIGAISGQHSAQIIGTQRRAQKIALHFIAPELQELQPLLFRLDALGHDCATKAVPHLDDGSDNLQIARIPDDVTDETSVNLERVLRKPLEIAET